MQNPQINRALDPGEAFFYMADRISCMNFVVFAERRGHLDPEKIRVGLEAIQRENPLLRARINWSDAAGLRFQEADGEHIDLLCQVVDDATRYGGIEDELSAPFAEGVAPLLRCVYLQIPEPASCILALCFHHAVADGRSGSELLRSLLTHIGRVTPAEVAASVAALPAMYEAFPPRFRWAEQAGAAEAVMGTLIGGYKRHGPITPLPWLETANPTRTPRLLRLRFAPDVTRHLTARCRERGISLHGVLCAAQLLAQQRLHAVAEPVTFFLSCPADMRPHLEPMPPTTPTGLFVTIISAAFALDADTQLWDLAAEVMAQTREQLARGEGHVFFNMYGLDKEPIGPARMERFAKTVLSARQNTMVSNIGKVALLENEPEVESISFALCPMPYQALFNAVSTYNDQLILNICYDAGKLSAESANTLATSMQALLLVTAEA